MVRKGGIIATLVARPDQGELDRRGIRGVSMAVKPDAQGLAEITQLIDEKKIKPVVTQTLPLTDAAEALRQAATHHTRGKIVLKIAEEPKN